MKSLPRGYAYDPDNGDPYPAPIPQPQPHFDLGFAALVGFTIVVAWLAVVGFCTVVMWGVG